VDSQKRLFLALALSFAVTMVYMMVFAPRTGQTPKTETAAVPDAGASIAPLPAPVPSTPVVPQENVPAREVRRDLSLVHYVFSSRGGGLTKAELQGPKMREQQHLSFWEGLSLLWGRQLPPAPQMDMGAPVPGLPLPLAVSIQGAQPLSESTSYRIEEGDGQLRFIATANGWEVVKVLQWTSDGLELAFTVSVKNVGAQPAAGELGVHYARAVDPRNEEKPSFFGGVGNLSSAECRVADDIRKLVPDDKPTVEHRGPVHFFGVDQQYFLASVFPLDAARDGRCVLSATATGRSVVAYFPFQLMPGQTAVEKFGIFVGPKDMDLLAAAPTRVPGVQGAVAVPQLEKTVDFGIWAFICKVLLVILKFFYGVFRNWGVAIIGLTVVVKLVLLPLTHKAMVSGEAMKKLQPKVEEIRKKFAEDKERQNREMMKLYQEAKVNPLGGCLPMLLQMPVWIALFTTLRNTYEIYGEPFMRPIWNDLTYKDPTYLLPLALGITMIVTQRLQPQMMDATQAKVMTYVMPVFFTAIMLNYPAGLSLYILTNNILSIGQQYGLRKYLEARGTVAPLREKRR